MKRIQLILLAVLALFSVSRATEHAQSILVEYKNEIIEASRSFGISPRLLASIVYAERTLNVKPGEDILDKVLALSGYNASLGIAQVKVETALWIRHRITDKNSKYYNASAAAEFASTDIVEQLVNPQTNLLLAAAYVRIIWDVWQPLLQETEYRKSVTGIVGTVYCLGLVRIDGSLRRPHVGARMNQFGEVAQLFYDSFKKVEEFPPDSNSG